MAMTVGKLIDLLESISKEKPEEGKRLSLDTEIIVRTGIEGDEFELGMVMYDLAAGVLVLGEIT